ARLGRAARPLTDAALARLRARAWERNNVRDLRNTIERMIIASDDPTLDIGHLPPDLARPSAPPTDAAQARRETAAPTDAPHRSYREQKRAAERAIVLEALEANNWVIGRTARALGLSDHSSLIKIMNRLGVRRPAR
ncbi:MAG: hypothetical protein F4Y73_08530, partial [Gemmatimonadetes bacterium]|nr:hypothetical protein [Gemmatimonadota bacterium]